VTANAKSLDCPARWIFAASGRGEKVVMKQNRSECIPTRSGGRECGCLSEKSVGWATMGHRKLEMGKAGMRAACSVSQSPRSKGSVLKDPGKPEARWKAAA